MGNVHIAYSSAIRRSVTLHPARVRNMMITKNKQPKQIESKNAKLVKYAYKNRSVPPERINERTIPMAATIRATGIVRTYPSLSDTIGEVIFAGRVSCMSVQYVSRYRSSWMVRSSSTFARAWDEFAKAYPSYGSSFCFTLLCQRFRLQPQGCQT